MSIGEKIALGGLGILVFVLFVVMALEPMRRYKLPTGKIIECSYFKETNKGNYVFKDCTDGIDYYTNGTIEAL